MHEGFNGDHDGYARESLTYRAKKVDPDNRYASLWSEWARHPPRNAFGLQFWAQATSTCAKPSQCTDDQHLDASLRDPYALPPEGRGAFNSVQTTGHQNGEHRGG